MNAVMHEMEALALPGANMDVNTQEAADYLERGRGEAYPAQGTRTAAPDGP